MTSSYCIKFLLCTIHIRCLPFRGK